MDGRLRMNVLEGEKVLLFMHDGGGNLAPGDFFENGHAFFLA